MYYFYNAPKSISSNYIPNNIIGIISFKNFSLCAIFNSSQLIIFENKTTSLIAYYQRSVESIEIYGNSTHLEWNSEATLIAISTDKGFLLIFSLKNIDEHENNFDKESTYSKEGFLNYPMTLTAEISLLDIIDFDHKILCLCLYRDDLLVAIEGGTLTRIKWDGRLLYNQEIKLTSISFFNDLEFSKASNLVKNEAIFRYIEWFPSLCGIIVLFQNGKSAFLHIPNHKLIGEQITGVWAEYLRHATCAAVNIKFRSVAYGLKTGEGVIYKTDEENGAFRIQHRLKILSNEYPDADKVTGSVICVKWSPDQFCLALCWENKGFSLWSVQGSLLFSSLGNKCGIEMNLFSLDWGCEGYSLWIIKKSDKICEKPRIFVFQMAKSVLMVNPTKDNHQHLLLLTSSCIIIGPRKYLSSSTINLEYIQFPELYIGSNWPIKYASIDVTGSRLAISGKYGFALYFLNSKKWRLFGNETQEHTVEISGGIVWCQEFVCFACFDNKDEKLQIRIYNSLNKIDNSLSYNFSIYSQILMMNIFDSTLVTLSIDGLVSLFEINIHKDSNTVSMEFIQVMSLEHYIEFAACVISLNLTSLHTELDYCNHQQSGEYIRYQSLLINYSGHVLMFQRDKPLSVPNNPIHSIKLKDNSFFKFPFRDKCTVKNDTIYFTGPLVVAYNVEIMWTPIINENIRENILKSMEWNTNMYTMENTLWLNCGAHGLRVWLPLNGNNLMIGNEAKPKYSFLSKRIMLTCKISNFYPLVVLNNEALLMCPMNEFSIINFDTSEYQTLPFVKLIKNRHIFLQHIIKELLRINLGINALDLTSGLKKLKYFDHSLELLLHEVLEEEATSKEPIPDPLLPRVVAFIQEFPNFLKTVVQCARKTELALWSYLFESAGNPKDLFEYCLLNNELDIAASYLIILQNSEHPIMSQKHAILLLDSALKRSNWSLVRNLIRFLKNIAINELKINEKPNYNTIKESSLSHATRRRYRSGGGLAISGSRQYSTSKSNKDDERLKKSKFSLNQSKNLNTSININESSSDDLSIDSYVGSKVNSPILFNLENENYEDSNRTNNFEKELDFIITKFGHKQFCNYHLHNLIEFFVNVQFTENQFICWMIRERSFCCEIQDPVCAFLCLHKDFNWPLQFENSLNGELSIDEYVFVDGIYSFEILSNNGSLNKMLVLSRKKLRFLANLLIKVDYWEWIFLILLMLEEYEEIIRLFQCFLLSIDNSEKIPLITQIMNFMNTILSWSCDEANRYTEILVKIKQLLFLLFEERINEIKIQKSNLKINNLENNSINRSNSIKDETLILSPVTQHSSLILGQLIIDSIILEEESEVINVPPPMEKPDFRLNYPDPLSLKNGFHNLSKLKQKYPVNNSSKSELLKIAYNLTKDNTETKYVSTDQLVSTVLDDQVLDDHGLTLKCCIS